MIFIFTPPAVGSVGTAEGSRLPRRSNRPTRLALARFGSARRFGDVRSVATCANGQAIVDPVPSASVTVAASRGVCFVPFCHPPPSNAQNGGARKGMRM